MRGVAVEITTKGLSFVVLEDTDRLLDWGVHRQARTEAQVRRVVEFFHSQFRPDVLILEEPAGSMKGERARDGLAWAEQYAHDLGLRVIPVPWRPSDKADIADRLQLKFPALSLAAPDITKYSKAEAPNYDVFVACARGVNVLSLLAEFPDYNE